jgi:hypothetical protein
MTLARSPLGASPRRWSAAGPDAGLLRHHSLGISAQALGRSAQGRDPVAARAQDGSRSCPRAPLPAPVLRLEPTGSALVEPGCRTCSADVLESGNKTGGRGRVIPSRRSGFRENIKVAPCRSNKRLESLGSPEEGDGEADHRIVAAAAPRFGNEPSEDVGSLQPSPIELNRICAATRPEMAVDSCLACPYRKTGSHFSGTCAGHLARMTSPTSEE